MTTPVGNEEELSHKLIAMFDQLFGLHPGFRPAHAKGMMCVGTFKATPAAAELTKAPHAAGGEIKVNVRFSNSTGVPLIPDTDPNASPRGIGIRFHLAEHVHTDIVAHSTNGFPTRTGDEFLEMLQAVATSGPDTAHPTPVEKFMTTHPAALRFVSAPKPLAKSFATESFFAVTAFEFINAAGKKQFGRFQIHPQLGNSYLGEEEAKAKGPNYLFEELEERLKREPVKLLVSVELAEAGDVVDDATISWPDDRKKVEFGTITLTDRVADDDPDAMKVIFDPIPRVEGLAPSADPLIELRAAIYLITGRRRRAAQAAHGTSGADEADAAHGAPGAK